MLQFVARVGNFSRRSSVHVGNLAWLTSRTLLAALRLDLRRLPVVAEQTLLQIRFTGLDAWTLVLAGGLGLGAITAIQAFSQLSFAAERYVGTLLAVVVVRELGPLATAVLVIGRSATAITAELAAMRLNQEVDALEAFGVDPAQYLLLPRFLGVTVSVVLLVALFNLAGLGGGFAVAHARVQMPLSVFVAALADALEHRDLVLTAAKSLAFGLSISIIACYHGLCVRRSQTEIPQAVSRGVVMCLVAVFAIDAVIAAVVYA